MDFVLTYKENNMKIKILIAVLCSIVLYSCSSVRGGSNSYNAYIAPNTKVNSFNEYDLDISQNAITYTIDISTPEGRMKLNKVSLQEAEQLALTEAIAQNNCAMIINPQYTHLKKGNRILRVTVYGFPAKYKNAQKDYDYVPEQNRKRVDINVNR